jgi:hypothetical protein
MFLNELESSSVRCLLLSFSDFFPNKYCRFASLLYTPEGEVAMQRLWDETMAELDFAGVRTILDSGKG